MSMVSLCHMRELGALLLEDHLNAKLGIEKVKANSLDTVVPTKTHTQLMALSPKDYYLNPQ